MLPTKLDVHIYKASSIHSYVCIYNSLSYVPLNARWPDR